MPTSSKPARRSAMAPADEKLAHLRHMYEPYVAALSQLLLMELPPWLPVPGAIDDWQSSPTE